ncbi:MAG: 3-deoxy-D-manno-octulosonic acid transferase, partial [Bryobacteraceae bacterium]|nr:3-deoxy-D-manno-octulosonic acid transferase [Bryobacteraceae bacterium]
MRRGIRNPKYFASFRQRLGFLPQSFQRTLSDSVWLHAVSVGEVLSAVTLIQQLRTALPDAPVFVSCTTLAGKQTAETKLAELVDGVFYAPIDYVWAIRRIIRRIRPA